MSAEPRAPRAARALLARLLPASLRDDVLGDLDTKFAALAQKSGRPRARRWYGRQMLLSILPVLTARNRHLPAPRYAPVNSTAQDLRFALRWLRGQPPFTAAVLATLALGIGAATTIFTIVNAVLLRPLQYADAERIVRVYNGDPGRAGVRNPATLSEAVGYRQRGADGLELLAAFEDPGVNLTGLKEPLRVQANMVTDEFFDVFGVPALHGRTFLPEEDVPGNDAVAVISYGLWQRAWGGDPAAVGSQLQVNGRQRRVIGIMPPTFDFFPGADIWMPRAYDLAGIGPDTALSHNQFFVGKLADGTSMASAEAALSATMAQVLEQYPEHEAEHVAWMVPLPEWTTARIRPTLTALSAAVGLLLLIGCANVANLLLGRGALRAQEIAVRGALGAGRGRIVRQMVVESTLLALLGGGLGILLARGLLRVLLALLPAELPRAAEISLDGTVVAFALGLSLFTGLLFGIVPALRTASRDAAETLHAGGSRTASRAGGISRTLVVAEVALVVALLLGAGLMMRSIQRLSAVDVGFDVSGTVAFRVELPASTYPGEAEIVPFFENLIARLQQLPGVQAVGAISWLPFVDATSNWGIEVEGRELPPDIRIPDWHNVAGDFFTAIGLPLQRGRGLTPADRGAAVVISETTANRYLPDSDPLDQRLRLRGESSWRTIVGVVGDYRGRGLEEAPDPAIYINHETLVFGEPWIAARMGMVVRTGGDPLALAGAIRDQVRALDAQLPIQDLRTMEDVAADLVAGPRFTAVLLGAFAVSALLLGAVGIYGVLTAAVAARQREIGIRQAIGAERRHVLAMVCGRGARTVAAGLVLGLLLGFWATRALMATMLFEVTPFDPVTLAAVIATITATAVVAILVPARRAMRIDPVNALRAE